jgi:hypothetical protein
VEIAGGIGLQPRLICDAAAGSIGFAAVGRGRDGLVEYLPTVRGELDPDGDRLGVVQVPCRDPGPLRIDWPGAAGAVDADLSGRRSIVASGQQLLIDVDDPPGVAIIVHVCSPDMLQADAPTRAIASSPQRFMHSPNQVSHFGVGQAPGDSQPVSACRPGSYLSLAMTWADVTVSRLACGFGTRRFSSSTVPQRATRLSFLRDLDLVAVRVGGLDEGTPGLLDGICDSNPGFS